MLKMVFRTCVATCCLALMTASSVSAGGIQWKAVGLDGKLIPNATVDVIAGGIIIASGDSIPGARENSLSFNSSALRGQNAAVTLRFRAIGREEVSLIDVLGDASK